MGSDRSCWFWANFFTIFLFFKKERGREPTAVRLFFTSKKKRHRLAFFRYLIHRFSVSPLGRRMVSAFSRILPKRSAKKKQDGWKMENLSLPQQHLEGPSEHVSNEVLIATVGTKHTCLSVPWPLTHETKNSGNVDAAHAAWHAVAAAVDESNVSASTFKSGKDVLESQSVEVDGEETSQRYPSASIDETWGDVDVDSGIAEGELRDKLEGADEASFKVWSAYQRWRVTKIRLGGILINQDSPPPNTTPVIFPLASTIYSSVLGDSQQGETSGR